MFLCKKCAGDRYKDGYGMESYGPCEDCKKVCTCSDC